MTWNWLQHAFAIEPPGPAEPTPAEREAVDWVCREVTRRDMTPAALLFLESSRPLSFVASQALHFFTPLMSLATDARVPRHLAAFLEKRGALEYISLRLEEQQELHERR